ncbi:MAG TPA: hypothetical protein VMV92_22440 [Streptosporangiaceae bacterium]|nr:hypothetical protein [Streptosporangiaceae bacterium]
MIRRTLSTEWRELELLLDFRQVIPRFRTPWAAAIAFVAPSIAIGVISTAFTDPVTAVGLLSTFGILGLVLMYLMANVARIAA